MKYLSFSINKVLALLSTVALFSFLLGHYLPPWFNEVSGRNAIIKTPFYHHTVGLQTYADELQPSGLIVFIGDSLTQALPVALVTPVGLNYGIGTDTTLGVLDRLPLYSSLSRSRAIVLAIGTNDLEVDTPDTVLERYRKILDSLPANPVVLCSAVLPVEADAMKNTGAITMQNINKFNKAIKTLCEQRNHVYITAPPALMDASGQLDAAYHLGDGVHLNSAGYAIWAQHLKEQFTVMGLPVT